MRLNRAIAACGLCSRRKADQLIADGKVKVNGKLITDFNFLVCLDKDNLSVNGKQLAIRSYHYILLHKPVGVVSTCKDEFERKSIINFLPLELRHLKPAGRLDYDSSGLILLTNNGILIQALTHPKSHIEKTYRLAVLGKCTADKVNKLTDGISLKGAMTAKAKVNLLQSSTDKSLLEITITEGKNRQLRRMCAQLGLPVIDLVRTGIDKLQLSKLAPGKWRRITKSELAVLAKKVKMDLTDLINI